ncbi:MAG: TssN family type VI secretion system protein [Bacteroidetes bacterium]|nr:TssN family type VI secretion system protein [Bacteroidota bacterium]
MRSILFSGSIPFVILFTIIALILLLIITFYVGKAKSKTGKNLLYMGVGGILIGIVGIRASWLNNPFYFYIVVMTWNFLMGLLHHFLSGRILGWTKTEAIGWRILYAMAVVFTGFAGLLMFVRIVDYDFFLIYNFSAVLTFFIPLLFSYAIESYLGIPAKIFVAQKPWIYNRSGGLQFKADEISHFFIVKYRLSAQCEGEGMFESLPMRAPGNLKLGDYYNATLEGYKVNQGVHQLEIRDKSNNPHPWYFFLADETPKGRMLDPNRTFLELGFTNPVYFGNSSPEEIENITMQADRDKKAYVIICKREPEYKSQLMKA